MPWGELQWRGLVLVLVEAHAAVHGIFVDRRVPRPRRATGFCYVTEQLGSETTPGNRFFLGWPEAPDREPAVHQAHGRGPAWRVRRAAARSGLRRAGGRGE